MVAEKQPADAAELISPVNRKISCVHRTQLIVCCVCSLRLDHQNVASAKMFCSEGRPMQCKSDRAMGVVLHLMESGGD